MQKNLPSASLPGESDESGCLPDRVRKLSRRAHVPCTVSRTTTVLKTLSYLETDGVCDTGKYFSGIRSHGPFLVDKRK